MVSAFIVMHNSVDVFQLDDDEWHEACSKNPQLLQQDKFLNYYERSANAWIEPKKDNYFDNETIISQFERLFILLKFKKAFKYHDIEILVDNARTHSAKIYDINQFNKKSGLKCVYKHIEWIDSSSVKRKISCFDSNNQYKGLFAIIKELGLIDESEIDKNYKLPRLRAILETHPAFSDNIRLEQAAKLYKIKIIWNPKYHCELNPIEGYWCDLKYFVRKYNTQDYNKLNNLIIEASEQYENKKLGIKLWNRFWKAIEMYENKSTYQHVLQTLFGAKSSSSCISHKKMDDFNTLLKK